jgi:hypothetical protein
MFVPTIMKTLNLSKSNQKAEGGVMRKRKTSCHAMLNHSCIRNAQLELVNGVLQTETWDILSLTGFLSWLKALTCSDWGLLLLVGR